MRSLSEPFPASEPQIAKVESMDDPALLYQTSDTNVSSLIFDGGALEGLVMELARNKGE